MEDRLSSIQFWRILLYKEELEGDSVTVDWVALAHKIFDLDIVHWTLGQALAWNFLIPIFS